MNKFPGNDAMNELASREPVPELPAPEIRVKLRQAFSVTQAELAVALGVSRQTVNAWERGSKEPSGENRQRYAKLLRTWDAKSATRKRADAHRKG